MMAEAHQAIQKTDSDNIELLSASIELQQIFTSVDENELRRLLAKVTGYNYCVIDTPPNLGGLTKASIAVADLVIVSSEVSRPALPATLYTIDQLREKPYKIILAGYKEPKPNSKAYQNNIMVEYKESLKSVKTLKTLRNVLVIPRDVSTAKQAEQVKTTKKSKERLYPMLRGFVK